ncbi:hypothetical protein OG582_39955 (plasmid) [Streptomyces anulatus]|uniref:hypothetical protein n=1 Tax=Streptomyces anulatus TaxID=1892 RepID=UPI002F910BF6
MKKTALLTMLSFADPDLREQIEAMPEGTALIGISTTGKAIAVDLDSESPHVLVCTASGGGSTTMLRSLTAQFLHQGAHALVLDPKRISHLWAKGLPTVTHRGNIAGIHDALVHLATELERRLDLDGDLDTVPRLIARSTKRTPRCAASPATGRPSGRRTTPRRHRPSPPSKRRSGSDARPASTSSSTDAPSPPSSEERPASCSPR